MPSLAANTGVPGLRFLRGAMQAHRAGRGDPRLRWRPLLLLVLVLMVPVACLLSLIIGPMDLSLRHVASVALVKVGLEPLVTVSHVQEVVIWDIRLSRVVLGLLVGAGLAVAGAAMQGVFRNPLADPGIIGVSSGGAIGAILMIVLGGRLVATQAPGWFALYAVPLAAMAGAVAMTALIYRLSLTRGQVDLTSMLLVGIAINSLGGAVIGLMTFLADDEELRTLTFWGLGSLGRANWTLLLPGAVFILLPLLLIPRYGRGLNALLLGEADAQHLGIDVRRIKRHLIVLAASVVGATVALCGAIGFIALVAPHIVRTAIGPDHRFLFPASALLGAALLLLADLGARTLVAPAELPIGILTALLGAPVFLFILVQRQRHAHAS